jgi:hypothetical protein
MPLKDMVYYEYAQAIERSPMVHHSHIFSQSLVFLTLV